MITRRQCLELVALAAIGAALKLEPAGTDCSSTEPDVTEPEPP